MLIYVRIWTCCRAMEIRKSEHRYKKKHDFRSTAMLPSQYPPAEQISDLQFISVMAQLRTLLQNLPIQLPVASPNDPTSKYNAFLNFSLDPDIQEKTGCEVATLGEQLERVFGWKARTTGDGIIPIIERGTAICALSNIFEDFYARNPKNNVLKKWVLDFAIGAEKVYEKYGVQVGLYRSSCLRYDIIWFQIPETGTVGTQLGKKRTRDDNPGNDKITTATRVVRDCCKVLIESSLITDQAKQVYASSTTGRGRTPNELIAQLVIKYVTEAKNEQGETVNKHSYACVSCKKESQGNAALNRVLQHAIHCPQLRESHQDLYRRAHDASVKGSLGAQLEQAGADSETGTQETEIRPVKVSKTQTTLDATQIREAGRKRKDEEQKTFQAKVDHIIMRLICVRGMVPTIVGSDEWKELMHVLNPRYHPSSVDMFIEKYIPQEAAFVRAKQIEKLQEEKNLTLTFDGTSIRKPQSFYTVHATTPNRESYLLDGHEGSDEHHTTQWIKERLMKVSSTSRLQVI